MSVTRSNNILIKNIYYMLTYAFKNLDSICRRDSDFESFDNIQDLFSVILYEGISNQLKRGLYKEYTERREKLSTIRSKIDIDETIKTNTQFQKKLICEYAELSENSYFNSVLKSTCLLLLRKGNIKQKNKKLLKKILMRLNDIDEIDLKKIVWSRISYHSNNAVYKMIIGICYLVVKGLLMTTDSGKLVLNQLLDNQCMHTLYEKFILEYYRRHHAHLKPNQSYIEWNVPRGTMGVEFLPNMKTDVMMIAADKTLIIDAKFYSHSMHMYFNKNSYISSNLYQIFSYVKNKDTGTGTVYGVLLYAQTQDEVPTQENTFNMGGNYIGIKILDLMQKFEFIKNKLDSIAENFMQEDLDRAHGKAISCTKSR